MKNSIKKEMLDYFSQELDNIINNTDKRREIEDRELDNNFIFVLNSNNTKLETKDWEVALIVTEYLNKKYGKQKKAENG